MKPYLYDHEPEKLTSSQSWLDMIKEADRLMYEDKKKKAL
jgi:hypothetical protein